MFILMECCDRDMVLIDSYIEEKDAYRQMESNLAESMGLENIPDNWNQTEFNREEDFNIEKDSAWYNRSDCKYDWKIFEIKHELTQEEIRQGYDLYCNELYKESEEVYVQLTKNTLEKLKKEKTFDNEPVVTSEDVVNHIAHAIHKAVDDDDCDRDWCLSTSDYGGFWEFYYDALEELEK